MSVRNRLLITGSPRSGKSALCQSLSDVPLSVSSIFEGIPLTEEGKQVAFEPIDMDYGELSLDEHRDRVLEIYATPGQRRFQFMWKNLARKCIGVIIVIDNRRPNPMADLDIYLDNFDHIIDPERMLIAINFADAPGSPHIADYAEHLSDRSKRIPVMKIDARSAFDSIYALSCLLCF